MGLELLEGSSLLDSVSLNSEISFPVPCPWVLSSFARRSYRFHTFRPLCRFANGDFGARSQALGL